MNDLIAGYFIGLYAINNGDVLKTGIAITIYNLLAFGGQYPVAMLIEKVSDAKKILLFSYLLNVFSISMFLFIPEVAIVLAGIASAIYHVAGGSQCAENNKATNIGLFAAPGVGGLILGGYLSWKQVHIVSYLLPVAVAFLFLLTRLPFQKTAITKNKQANAEKHSIDTHDIIMILLLLIISLRSATWNIFQLIHENNFEWLLSIAIAAVVGKIAGGWLADKIGWRLYALSSAVIATPLVTVFKKELLLFCIGIGILQSGIPATTSLLIQSLKGNTVKAIALSFGTAIIIGSAATIIPPGLLLSGTIYMLIVSILLLTICSIWYKRIASHTI